VWAPGNLVFVGRVCLAGNQRTRLLLGDAGSVGPVDENVEVERGGLGPQVVDAALGYPRDLRERHQIGVRTVRLHDGRHTAATLLLEAGVHPRVVMELLGHSQMRTTTDTYSHIMPALAREAADQMGAALWG
jgi:integrase